MDQPTEASGGLMIDGQYVPAIGLFGVRGMKWGAKHKPEHTDESHIERGEN